MILDLFLPLVFHAPSYCSFTSNLTMFWLIVDYWMDNGIYSAFIRIIINLIIDKSIFCYKITINIDKVYRILNYTRIKPRSRPPQKKIWIFYAPRFFSGQNRKKKCANYTSKYSSFWNCLKKCQDEGQCRKCCWILKFWWGWQNSYLKMWL